MSIFYKYYSYLPPEYFKRPTIKLASPMHLNDPFESLLPMDIKEYIEQFADEHEGTLHYPKENVISSLNSIMRSYGITSFSETQRNLLMWAHYANQHQGICIGYDTNLIFSEKQKKSLKSHAILRKVNYDNVRHEDFGNLKKMKSFSEIVNYILMKIMLTKGNDWIYEKEYRYIIELSKSDYVTLAKKDIKENTHLNNRIREMLDEEAITESSTLNDSDVTCYIPSEGKDLYFGYLNFHKEASYFIDINPKSIKRIYFGCRSPKEYSLEMIKSILECRNNFDGIYINKMQLDKKRFELRIPPETEEVIHPGT
ncbi:DUF2971 domain-containing protein [Aeromonas hydrophila]|uniref:DUF2971 domain-containing protein n=1 Tax=Aeromonas hydrophila TaxID=644 RepID=UPI002B46F721|nr:DUF2971 domain-containing protein [Aeromonas hydrophila]